MSALGLHLPLWAALLAATHVLPGAAPDRLGLAWVEGGLAFVLSRALRLPPWWAWINLFFFPLLVVLLEHGFAPAWALAALAVLALTSLGSVRSRVPLFLSSDRAVATLAASIPKRPDLRVIDLGCGWGGPLAGLARRRPDLVLHGVEAAPLNWLIARLRLDGLARVRLGDLWAVDLAPYDVVYAYLSPAPMSRLWAKACREMRPGSLFISNSFEVPGVAPERVIPLDDLTQSKLLIWRIP
ncbi:MAG: class I SAM-dependent methyltransferase [Thiobacillaceae bacterium]|nr:class I SAM-dependent methyltransferase [Thiobacillaceae bacterium]